MRVGFCRADDSGRRASWSGIPSHMLRALTEYRDIEVVSLGPLPNPLLPVFKSLRRISIAFTGKEFNYKFSQSLNGKYGTELRKRIDGDRFDVLFFPAASGILASQVFETPAIYASDATFRVMCDYYPEFTNMWAFNRNAGDSIERDAIARAQASVFASHWAATSAIEDYGARDECTFVLPFGANMVNLPERETVLEIRQRAREPWKLLFVGSDWVRKGGQLAVDSVKELRGRGVRCELTIVGCRPLRRMEDSAIRFVPFLRKDDPREEAILAELYREADVFLLPTRSEAAGVVYSEASAFGLPIVSTKTGGTSTYVKHGQTGYLLDPGDSAIEYADAIERTVSDKEEYMRLARNARDTYEVELNWRHWGERMRGIIDTVV